MVKYSFKAQDASGSYVEGAVEAADQNTAQEIIFEKGYTLLSLSEARNFSFNAKFTFLNKIKTKDLVIFARQFSVLIGATVPVVQALQILSKQTVNEKLIQAILDVADKVNGGLRLSDALAHHSKIFSDFYVNMIRSGEASGKLSEVLTYLADQQERDYELTSRIKGAMIYPAAILIALVGIGVFMMIFVLPSLLDILTETNATLPLSTRILIGTSDFLVNYWWLVIMLLIGLVVGIHYYLKLAFGRRQWDLAKLYVPIFGGLFRKIFIIRFTRSLSTLISGGVNITNALDITAEIVGNQIFKDLIKATSVEVENGNSISSVFVKSTVMPQMVSQIMLVGEETGHLDEVLDKLTKFYTLEVDNIVRNMVSLLEPLIIMIIGGGVGLLVASIILPIYQVATSF